jgi:hypothetical protein
MSTAAARCDFCGRTFSSSGALEEHVRVAHMGRPWAPRCEICDVTFESPADLKVHNENVHRAGKA